MTYLKEITRLCYLYGDTKNKHLISLSNVWLYNSCGDINLYIKDKKLYLLTYTNFEYSVASLRGCEQYSILSSLEKYCESVKEMLNTNYNLDISF